MTPYYLKFTDESAAITALAQYRITDDHGNQQWQTASHTHALDAVGTIYKPTGVMLQSEMGEYPQMAPINGYHVNLMIDTLPVELDAYVINPVTPSRVWG